jgi:alkylation response protein AidB-like acyl-CoA dehydrogenase
VTDWIARATFLVEQLRAGAAEAERLRRLPDATIRTLHDSGLLRLYQPARFGGAEAPYALQVDVLEQAGRGCGSAAWVLGVLASHSWVIGMMDPQAQDDVWGTDPTALAANAFFTGSSRIVPVDGGFRLSGQWSFASGIDLCQWVNLNCLVPQTQGPPEHRFMLVPARDWRLVDDWHVAGLAGTGSKSLVLDDVFVPTHRTLATLGCRGGPTPGSAVNPSYLYLLPLLGIFPLGIGAPALGIGRAALDIVMERVGARGAAAGARGSDNAGVQLRLAESAAELDAAAALLRTSFAAVDAMGQAGEVPALERRARWRRDIGYAVLSAVRAVERLQPLNGGSGLALDNPFQRCWRDVHGVASHAALSWDGQAQTWGRVQFGLPPADARL